MRGRLARLGVIAVLFNAVLALGSLSAPELTYACTCAPTDVAEFIGNPDYVIVSGTIADVDEVRGEGTFVAGRIFQGALPAPRMPTFGTGGGDCSIRLVEGMQFIGVAIVSREAFTPVACLPFGDLRDESGKAILADLRRVFPDPAPPATETAALVPAAIAAVGFGLLLVLAVVAVSVHGRSAS